MSIMHDEWNPLLLITASLLVLLAGLLTAVFQGSTGLLKGRAWHRGRHELELSKRLQQSVLPAAVQQEGIEVRGLHVPSAQLSGDMYTWVIKQEHIVLIVLMDVMGHGIPASLLSMYIQLYMQTILQDTDDPDPVQLLEQLNAQFCGLFEPWNGKSLDSALYCTAICLKADLRLKQVDYVNAGHPYGVLLADGKQVKLLHTGGLGIGIDKAAVFAKESIAYDHQARVVLFTDGLFEVYGSCPRRTSSRLEELLLRYKEESVNCFLGALKRDLARSAFWPDDICVIVMDLNAKLRNE